jgi:hypothetical protein
MSYSEVYRKKERLVQKGILMHGITESTFTK